MKLCAKISFQPTSSSFSFLLESPHKIEEIGKNIIEERFFQARQKPIKISNSPNWKLKMIAVKRFQKIKTKSFTSEAKQSAYLRGRSQTTFTRFGFFDHLIPSVYIFYGKKVYKKSIFLTTYPPPLVNVVCERLVYRVSRQEKLSQSKSMG